MNETFAYEIKTYVAIWFDYIGGIYYLAVNAEAELRKLEETDAKQLKLDF